MFILLLIALLTAAGIHAYRHPDRSSGRTGETFLVYILVGYCGIPMLAVSIGILAAPERMAEMLPVGGSTPIVAFFGWAYLGMSLIAILALRFRGTFLLGPAVAWGVYFAGATVVHLHQVPAGDGHGGLLFIFSTHGLVSVLLAGALIASGVLRGRSTE